MDASSIVALSSHMQRLHSISSEITQTTKGYSERFLIRNWEPIKQHFFRPHRVAWVAQAFTSLTWPIDMIWPKSQLMALSTAVYLDWALIASTAWCAWFAWITSLEFWFLNNEICRDFAWQYDVCLQSSRPWQLPLASHVGSGWDVKNWDPEIFWSETWARLIFRWILCQGLFYFFYFFYLFQIKIHKSAQTLQDTWSKSQCL